MNWNTISMGIRATALSVLSMMVVLGLWPTPVTAEDRVAVKAGRIITISGKDIAPGVILVEDGRITAVGSPGKIKIPWNAVVVDATGQTVMPGMIEAHTSRGLGVVNETMQTVPYLHVRDSINTVDFYFEDALRDGIIAMGAMPGNRTLVGGQGMVVKPHGITVEAMAVKERLGMKISLLPGRNTSHMAHMQKLRRYFFDFQDEVAKRAEARLAREETARAKEETVDPETPLDVKKQPLQDLLSGRMKAFVYCPAASDVFKALELKETFKFDMVLILGVDCFKAVDAIARAKVPVILASRLIHRELDPETRVETDTCTALVFHEAGVPFALQTEASSLGRRHLWFQAAIAVQHGVPREAALKAITLTPARLLGIEDRFGSIAVGKDANLVILTGDPLDYATWVDRVLYEGKVIYNRKTDENINRLFRETPPGKAEKTKPEDNEKKKKPEKKKAPAEPAKKGKQENKDRKAKKDKK